MTKITQLSARRIVDKEQVQLPTILGSLDRTSVWQEDVGEILILKIAQDFNLQM